MFEEFEKIENADLKQFSTMRTGGIAKFVLFPKNVAQLKKILAICKKEHLKFYCIGNGSNILFDDAGFDGALISLKNFDFFRVGDLDEKGEEVVEVGAGVNLFAFNMKLANAGLSGLEFSYGVPATVGGFVVSNGGCFGHEVCEFVDAVTVFGGKNVKEIPKENICFAYRHSSLGEKIVLSVKFLLKVEKSEKITEKMQFYLKKKRESQPCDLPSLGSVFKKIEDKEPILPAKLIDNLGLKGVKIGGAEVSKKHAGFIVNTGGATSQDVLDLVRFLESRLFELGYYFEREIVILKN